MVTSDSWDLSFKMHLCTENWHQKNQTKKPKAQDVWLLGQKCWPAPSNPRAPGRVTWGPRSKDTGDSPALHRSGYTRSFPSEPEEQEGATGAGGGSLVTPRDTLICLCISK